MKSYIHYNSESDFPIDNIPFGVYRTNEGANHICTAIGDYIFDLYKAERAGTFNKFAFNRLNLFSEPFLNKFMSQGKETRVAVRNAIQNFLSEDNKVNAEKIFDDVFLPIDSVKMLLPVRIGDYTDFYSSKEHATNVGIMFRGKENALMPNWLHIPVAYHGRASSIVVDKSPVRRPKGQVKPDDSEVPIFRSTSQFDFELEMGFFVGKETELGKPVKINNAGEHIFGFCIVNDWSARDIQKWEYVPLGPFLSKNFSTSVSPWVVTLEALEPFITEGPIQTPEPLDYLKCKNITYDIILEVYIKTNKLNERFLISKSNYKHLYWNMYQQLTHHTITGCNLNTGDMLASGTISGPDKKSFGSLLELTWRGTEPIILPNGAKRTFLEDGDELTIKAFCEKDGLRIGFGEVSGTILPSDL